MKLCRNPVSTLKWCAWWTPDHREARPLHPRYLPIRDGREAETRDESLAQCLAPQPALHKYLLLLPPLLLFLEQSEISATCSFLRGALALSLRFHLAVQLRLAHDSPAGPWI